MLLSHKSGTKVTLFLIYNKFICLFIQSFYYPPIVFRFFRQPCNPLSAEKSRPPRNRFCLCIGTTYRIQKHKYPYTSTVLCIASILSLQIAYIIDIESPLH